MQTFCISLFGSINLYNIYGKYLDKVPNSAKSKELEVKKKIYSERFSRQNRHKLSYAAKQGACGIPIEKLKILADALSVPIRNLFPRRKVLKEDSCFDKAKTQEMYNFIEKTGGHKAIYALTKSVRAEEESNIKAARIRIAKNLVKAGFDTEVIYQATGLSIEEYADKERYEPNGGQEIKKWRIIREYTQEELAKKLNVGSSQIHHYEQGSVTLLSERLWEIARSGC
ncbi:helix-turn-helix domain-containing protein [Wolbachia endosymbiont of Cylisticus convexus]|uniref:helix-turn-helix domain-containing protein n=1 Tax=Wolbachia endosymbiont of Cylisticus convexus TaxID=118728 RepID=UPI001F303564|nr:helix-turn-helix transcriptional regulator [Wolbachia endosymbiont of Cylisticus convexus]